MPFDVRIRAANDQRCPVKHRHNMGRITSPRHASQFASEARPIEFAGCLRADGEDIIGDVELCSLCKAPCKNGFGQWHGRCVIATGFHHNEPILPISAEAAFVFIRQHLWKP